MLLCLELKGTCERNTKNNILFFNEPKHDWMDSCYCPLFWSFVFVCMQLFLIRFLKAICFGAAVFFGRRKCVSLSLPEASCLGETLQTSLFNNKTKPAREILNPPALRRGQSIAYTSHISQGQGDHPKSAWHAACGGPF